MTSFQWTDRQGAVHRLVSAAPIEEEVETVSGQIDRLVAGIASADPTQKAELRMAIGRQMDRLQKLADDGARWNTFALEQTKTDAAALAKMIEQLEIDARPMLIIAVLHDEHERLMADTEKRPALLAGPMTSAQRAAVRRSTIEPKPTEDATRGNVHEWLKGDPTFYRPRSDEGGWFEWSDKNGAINRLVSPLRIEKEIALILHQLSELRPGLQAELSRDETVQKIEAVNAVTKRLPILEADLERFISEAKEREDEQWQEWEVQWKASRESK